MIRTSDGVRQRPSFSEIIDKPLTQAGMIRIPLRFDDCRIGVNQFLGIVIKKKKLAFHAIHIDMTAVYLR